MLICKKVSKHSMRQYKSKSAAEYFCNNRTSLDDFYDSEKSILKEYVNDIKNASNTQFLLDIGCAAGGLGKSLKDILHNKLDYTGIDINPESIKLGKKKFKDLNLIEGDFSQIVENLSSKEINTIISLSCIDWNENFEQSMKTILDLCKKKKSDFIFTFRAAEKECNDIKKSYQFVNYKNLREGEIANYVVISYENLQKIIKIFEPFEVVLYAYRGKPSSVAVTPYSELIFGCVWLKNCFIKKKSDKTLIKGQYPIDLIMNNN